VERRSEGVRKKRRKVREGGGPPASVLVKLRFRGLQDWVGACLVRKKQSWPVPKKGGGAREENADFIRPGEKKFRCLVVRRGKKADQKKLAASQNSKKLKNFNLEKEGS